MTENEVQLTDLIDKLDLFVNGTETDLVTTDNGQVPTLAAIAKKSKGIRYVLEAVTFPTKASVKNAILTGGFLEGEIARVYKDPSPANNGFWIVDENAPTEPLKVDLVDLYGLNLPEGTKYISELDKVDIGTTQFLKFKFLASPVDPFYQQLYITVRVRCLLTGNRFIKQTRGHFMFSYDDTIGLKQIYTPTTSQSLNVDLAPNIATDFMVTAVKSTVGADTVIGLRLDSQELSGFDYTGYDIQVEVENVRKSQFLND